MVHRRRATEAVEQRNLEAPRPARTHARIDKPNRHAMKGLPVQGQVSTRAALDAIPIRRWGFFIKGAVVLFLVLFCQNWLLSLPDCRRQSWYCYVCRIFLSRDLAVVPLRVSRGGERPPEGPPRPDIQVAVIV